MVVSAMQSSPKVIHVAFSPLGGAGAVTSRLAEAQQRLGWQTELVSMVDTPFPRWAWRHPRVAASALADFYLVRKASESSFFSLFRNQHDARLGRKLTRSHDIVHLHLLPGYIWPPALFKQTLATRKLIWSVQDLWPITGGCHYTNGCNQFKDRCSDCPQVHRRFRPAVASAQHAKRTAVQNQPHLHVVTPSEWAAREVQSSTIMQGVTTSVIPNPVDTNRFRPLDRPTLRARHQIPADTFVIGVGAANLKDERKQIPLTLATLRDWIGASKLSRNILVLVFGGGGPLPGGGADFRFVGTARDADTLCEWYNLMDAYVSLSRYETFGNTLAESAACETPSVCLTGSGMSDVVVNEKTGYHVDAPDDVPPLLERWVSIPTLAREFGKRARAHACAEFDVKSVAARFIDLYTP